MGDGTLVTKKPVVLVTGFGPFCGHPVNASWQAVECLQRSSLAAEYDLITCQVPVEYDYIRAEIPRLWQSLKPKLVVHVGVSGEAREITLEQRAYNSGYVKRDVVGACPATCCCIEGATDCLVSDISMARVRDAIGSAKEAVASVVSHDPGRYLCDFIYYTSLSIDPSCTAFIHVPPLDRPYSAEQLAHALQQAIAAMLAQLGPQPPSGATAH